MEEWSGKYVRLKCVKSLILIPSQTWKVQEGEREFHELINFCLRSLIIILIAALKQPSCKEDEVTEMSALLKTNMFV